MIVLLFAAGLVLLIVGAESLVRGASRLAAAAGLSPLVIGLTVVAFGTSAPELAVSVSSSWNGQAGLALSNVVGSNIFNVLFILGLTGLIAPLAVTIEVIRRDVPVMIALSGVVLLLSLDGALGRIEGLVLLAALVAYVVWCVRTSRAEARALPVEAVGVESRTNARDWFTNLAFVAAGLAALVVGAGWLVDGAVVFARAMGVGETVVGLTIVAAGTSLPEVATSVVAAVRGQRDIAVGNVVGSNVFNLLGVVGASAVAAPRGLEVGESVRHFDLPFMVATAVVCLPFFVTGRRLARGEAATFLVFYVLYLVALVLRSTGAGILSERSWTFLAFALPLSLVTIAGLSWWGTGPARARIGGRNH
ncbi:MAG: calcium/sodium antiporter [Planctomycetota bacterium]